MSRIRDEIESRVGPPEPAPARTYEAALRSIQAQLYSLRAGVDAALLAIKALLGDGVPTAEPGACDHRRAVKLDGFGGARKLLCPPPPDGCGEEIDA